MKGLLFSLVRAGLAGGVAIDDDDDEREETERHCCSRDWEHAAQRGGGDLQRDLSPSLLLPSHSTVFGALPEEAFYHRQNDERTGLQSNTQLEGE